MPANLSHGAALLVCSSPSMDRKPVPELDGLVHRPPLAPLDAESLVEWELDGRPAAPLTVFDERDPAIATYNGKPLCVAFMLPATEDEAARRTDRTVDLPVRVTRPHVFVTVSHVLWD